MIATLMNLVLVCSMFAVAKLARPPEGANLKSGDLFLGLGLLAAGATVAMWSGQRIVINVMMLAVIAFNLGRWRGLEEGRPKLSEAPHEIWQR